MKKTEMATALADGEYNPNFSHNAFKVEFVSENLSHLLGEVLTILDASIRGDQNKAIKSLVKRSFSEKQEWFAKLSRKLEEEEGNGHIPLEDWEYGLVPYDAKKVYSFSIFN